MLFLATPSLSRSLLSSRRAGSQLLVAARVGGERRGPTPGSGKRRGQLRCAVVAPLLQCSRLALSRLSWAPLPWRRHARRPPPEAVAHGGGSRRVVPLACGSKAGMLPRGRSGVGLSSGCGSRAVAPLGSGSRASMTRSTGDDDDALALAAAHGWARRVRGWARWAYPWGFLFFLFFI
jgi:hypothetical protein